MWSRLKASMKLLLPLLLTSSPMQAEVLQTSAEPTFCVPDVFLKLEIPQNDAEGIKRLHMYRLGETVLAGMAIGESEASSVARLAAALGVTQEDHFCTWYVNRGNVEAERSFWQIYLPSPSSLSAEEAAGQYGELFGPAFAEGTGSIWWCLEEKGFLAVGCNGQLHRGPTVFGMVLAALGCSPEHAAEIVNRIWGLNGVPPDVRLAAIRRGYDLGSSRPELRSEIQKRLTDPHLEDKDEVRRALSPPPVLQPIVAP